MKDRHDKLKKAERAVARVESCTISVDHAVKIAQSIGGTVFDVRLKEVDRQLLWRVKILRNREQLKVYVHANTGNIFSVKAEATAAESNQKVSANIPTPSFSS